MQKGMGTSGMIEKLKKAWYSGSAGKRTVTQIEGWWQVLNLSEENYLEGFYQVPGVLGG